MTIGAWIIFLIFACVFIAGGIFINVDSRLIGAVVGVVLTGFLFVGMQWYYSNTAAGARAIKTQESNLNNGVKREVKVYDATGNLIKEYKGKFDIEYDDDRILFDDENGLRHIIYYPTGTVIVDEIAD